MELLAFASLVLGLVGLSILRRHLVVARQLRLREILHAERMKAMEQHVELPEANDLDLAEQASHARGQGTNGRDWLVANRVWVRLVSLCLGLTAFFGGIGTCVGLAMTTAEKMNEYWAMGLIPVSLGVGLLIFYAMSARLTRPAQDEAATRVG